MTIKDPKEKNSLIDTKDCPYYLISRAYFLITSVMKKALADAGAGKVKPAYLGVLLTLWHNDGLKVVELGRKSGLEPSSMTGMIDRMERDELVCRRPDPKDRRVLRIFLSDIGKRSREPVMEVIFSVINSVFDDISDQDMEITKNVLRKVLSNTANHKGRSIK